jgi:hypothetical protein
MYVEYLVHQYWFQEKKYLAVGDFLSEEEAHVRRTAIRTG